MKSYHLLIVLIISCFFSSCKKNPEPPSEGFKKQWYTGKAELSSYNLQQARYGEIRNGEAVLIFVTEDFSTDKAVKLDEPDKTNNKVRVLKMNMTKKYTTGIYPYSMMLSVFTPVSKDGEDKTLKVTSSVQEWCGHSFSQLRLTGNSYNWQLHSYFEKEGEQDKKVETALLEDELWNRIRMAPEALPQGNVSVVPGLYWQRLSHAPLEAQPAVLSLSKGDTLFIKENGVQLYTIQYAAAQRTLQIYFQAAFPHTILGWQETYPDGFGNKKMLTTKAVRKKLFGTITGNTTVLLTALILIASNWFGMTEKPFYRKSLFLYILLLLSGAAYFDLAYFTVRENFLQVISLFTFLFTVYFFAYKFFSTTHFKYLLIAGIVFRMLLLFSVPNLSDDVYRFIWDGRLATNGINPFSYLPGEILQMPPVQGITKELYKQLNSPDYYTVYPPILQGIFWLAGILFTNNVFAAIVFLKCIIVLFELGIFFLLIQLLKKLLLPKHLSLLYIMNPLVITELTGNVHFEGVMIFFILLSFILLLYNYWQASAICLAFGIATKLIPVLFLPLMIQKLGWKKGVLYSLITGAITFLLFALVFDIASAQNLLKSIDLFIRKFEFNASIYYVLRWMGTKMTGYNIIAFAGPLLSLLAAVIILVISFRDKKELHHNIWNKALFIITTWYLFSTTIHPWYICLHVALSVFTSYRFAIIWSFTALLSYAAYRALPVQENLWLLAAGYIFMIGYGFYEWNRNKINFS